MHKILLSVGLVILLNTQLYSSNSYIGLDNELAIQAGHVFWNKMDAGVRIRYSYGYDETIESFSPPSYSFRQEYQAFIAYEILLKQSYKMNAGISFGFNRRDLYRDDDTSAVELIYTTEAANLQLFINPEIAIYKSFGFFMRLNLLEYGFEEHIDGESGKVESDTHGFIFNLRNSPQIGLRWYF